MSTLSSKRLPWLVGIAALALGAAMAWFAQSLNSARVSPSLEGLLWPPPRILEAFSLIDHTGRPFEPPRLDGKWSLVFFGFTSCPDVCPNTLRILQHAAPEFPPDTQVLFVSVDPQRDTPQKLAAYVAYFDPRFIGVTGTPTAIESLTRRLGIVSMHGAPDKTGNYTVDHTASVFLIDPARRMVGMFSQPLTLDSLLDSYHKVRQFVESQK